MTGAEVQSLLHLLCGSVICCKEKGGCGNGEHVISVTHPDGRVTSVKVSDMFSPAEKTLAKWRLFNPLVLELNSCDFNDLRKEATRVLKYFVSDTIPYVSAGHSQCPLVPEFWRVNILVSDLELSRKGITEAHGEVKFIRLQDVISWNLVRPFKENLGNDVKLSGKSKFKAFLQLIIEAAAVVSRLGGVLLQNQVWKKSGKAKKGKEFSVVKNHLTWYIGYI